jgi:glycerophosphoryl diester phosphodiesterase
MPRPDPRLFACALILSACMPQKNLHPDIHGHRGCRGLEPENSMPAFLKATELGCDYLEMDVVLSGDGDVVISHEPWMRHDLCLTPDDSPISLENERSFNIYKMTTREIRQFDCGSVEQAGYPKQDKHDTHKPTLSELVDAVDEHALMSGVAPPSFNIEIKSDPEWYGVFQPAPDVLARAIIDAMDSLGIADRCMLQSFDPAVLETIHADRPEIPLAYLVENGGTLEADLAKLTFVPAIYSPHFTAANEALLHAVRAKEMELVVWTVNESADIRSMLNLGVDGIISDYPDRVFAIMENRE